MGQSIIGDNKNRELVELMGRWTNEKYLMRDWLYELTDF